jgi:arylformamidase
MFSEVYALQNRNEEKSDSTQEISPTYSNISYGEYNHNVLDLWVATGTSPRPLLIYIHGGGWLAGNKEQIYQRIPISKWLQKGVSVASVDYRYSSEAILPAPVFDAARAIQFLRYKAKDFNINPLKVGLQGGSAGGCSALWILFHDDLADSLSSDPVARESSRIQGAIGQFPQTTIDPILLSEWIGEKAAIHPMIHKAVGAIDYDDLIKNYNQYKPLIDEFSPINHVDQEDPPLFLTYPSEMTLPPSTSAAAIHHRMLGIKLIEKAEAIGYKVNSETLKITSFSEAEISLEKILVMKDTCKVLNCK